MRPLPAMRFRALYGDRHGCLQLHPGAGRRKGQTEPNRTEPNLTLPHLSWTSTPSCRSFSAPAAFPPDTAEEGPPAAPVALSGVLVPGGDVAVSPGAITNLLHQGVGGGGGKSEMGGAGAGTLDKLKSVLASGACAVRHGSCGAAFSGLRWPEALDRHYLRYTQQRRVLGVPTQLLSPRHARIRSLSLPRWAGPMTIIPLPPARTPLSPSPSTPLLKLLPESRNYSAASESTRASCSFPNPSKLPGPLSILLTD